VQQSLERLLEGAADDLRRQGTTGIYVNSRVLPLALLAGPRTTKWFGVIPKDVKGNSIKKAIVNAFSSDSSKG
jgi:hypothetical protein